MRNLPGAVQGSRRLYLSAVTALAFPLLACPAPRLLLPDGAVVIAQVLPGGAGSAAGLRKGDRIVELVRLPAPPAHPKGARLVARDPLSVTLFEIEQAPRGSVDLFIERAAAEADYAAGERFAQAQNDERFLALIRQRRSDARNLVENPGVALKDVWSAIEIHRRLAPGSLAEAAAWAVLGRQGFQRENLDAAVAALDQS